jgi:hypothetical protein
MSREPATDLPGGVFIRRRQAALGPTSHHQDPPATELTAACSRAPCSTAPFLNIGQFPFVSRSFHACEAVVINFFEFRIEPWCSLMPLFKAGQIQRPGSDLSCKAYAETEAFGGQIHCSRFFHAQRLRFSRLVLAFGANFTLV